MEITGPSTANFKPNYKALHTNAVVCFSYQLLQRVTTQKNRFIKAELPKTAAVDSGADTGSYTNCCSVPQLDLSVLCARRS
jgi:hypothetical protein